MDNLQIIKVTKNNLDLIKVHQNQIMNLIKILGDMHAKWCKELGVMQSVSNIFLEMIARVLLFVSRTDIFEYIMNYYQKEISNNRMILYLLLKNQECIGLAEFTFRGNCFIDYSNLKHIQLNSLIIHPKHHGKGYGKTFLGKIKTQLKRQGYQIVTLMCMSNNVTGNIFYPKIGFINDHSTFYLDKRALKFIPSLQYVTKSESLKKYEKCFVDVVQYMNKYYNTKMNTKQCIDMLTNCYKFITPKCITKNNIVFGVSKLKGRFVICCYDSLEGILQEEFQCLIEELIEHVSFMKDKLKYILITVLDNQDQLLEYMKKDSKVIHFDNEYWMKL